MSKRSSKEIKRGFESPAKRQKCDLEITFGKEVKTNNQKPSSKKQEEFFNWDGDFKEEDFEEEDLQEIDLLSSQTFSQKVNVSVDESFNEPSNSAVKTTTKAKSSWPNASFSKNTNVSSPKKSTTAIFPTPSTSTANNKNATNTFKLKTNTPVKCYPENKCSFKNSKIDNIHKMTVNETISITQSSVNFKDFERNLWNGNNMNSTFLSQTGVVVVPDDAQFNQVSDLKKENKKLQNDLLIKEGEAAYLRIQLQREQQKLLNEKLEFDKLIEKQEDTHKTQFVNLKREVESLNTQLNFKDLEMISWKEKTKLMEKGSVKLVEPYTANSDLKTKIPTNNRISPTVKVQQSECETQVNIFDKTVYKVKDSVFSHPLKKIPKSVFESSEPEKPIIDICINEKIGKRNLPILQEAESLRIFENTELVKPIVSFVDNKQLSVQFYLSDLSRMLNKTEIEINSSESLPTINKIVATTRELLLNTLTSLKKILEAMTSDDVRDMNDSHILNYSTIKISNIDDICGAKRLYENERGIEIRRSLAVISHIVLSSNYLGEYIIGKRKLNINEDYAYKHFIQQLKTYNSWSEKECDFEFLEMILQLVVVIGSTRRAHQFCGVINAIALTLNNTHKSVGFCSVGLDYVSKIFRELVFYIPLLECIPSISEMLMTFSNCTTFIEKLCLRPKSSSIVEKSGSYTFEVGPKTCTIEIFVKQLNNLTGNPITMMNTFYAVVSFIKTIIQLEVLPWREEKSGCKCCYSLIKFALKSLYDCTIINVDDLEVKFQNLAISSDASKLSDRDFWYKLKRKQKDIVEKGIQFLHDIVIRESHYLLQSPNMAYHFFLFFHYVKNMSDLRLLQSDSDIFKILEIVLFGPAESLAKCSQNLTYMNEKAQKLDNVDEKSKQTLIRRSRRQCFSQSSSSSSSS